VLPGLWRLRLPLTLPGVPHVNAWAIAAGSGVVLIDCGMHEPGSMAQLETAMAQVGLRIQQVSRLVITHAHLDHWGQAATVIERTGCPLWMSPHHQHATSEDAVDPEQALARRLEIARQSGVPPAALARLQEQGKDMPAGIAAIVLPDVELVDGVVIETDLGPWTVYETPGHAPSHVCLYQPERRLLISGDHVLGRISLFFEYGWTPDPIDEFLRSLDVVAGLDARLCMSGHGRTFTDVRAHIDATRALVAARLDATLAAAGARPATALEYAPAVFGEPLEPATRWRLYELLCYLHHLEREGAIVRGMDSGGIERWLAQKQP